MEITNRWLAQWFQLWLTLGLFRSDALARWLNSDEALTFAYTVPSGVAPTHPLLVRNTEYSVHNRLDSLEAKGHCLYSVFRTSFSIGSPCKSMLPLCLANIADVDSKKPSLPR